MQRVLLKDVAAEVGVSVSCVARALKGRADISASTRSRIRAAADKLGYRPDPMLSALSEYRKSKRPVTFQGTLALLATQQDEKSCLANPETRDLLKGARERAVSLGYFLDYFNIGETERTFQRAREILRVRGIRGALALSLPPAGLDPGASSEPFICVGLFSPSLPRGFPSVSSHHVQSMQRVLEEAGKRNYRHPALVLQESTQARHVEWRMAFAEYSQRFPQSSLYAYKGNHPDALFLQQWAEKKTVDVLICCGCEKEMIKAGAYGRPDLQGVGVVCMDLPNPDCGLSGIYQNRAQIGSLAVEYLHGILQRGEAEKTVAGSLLIPGAWIEGTSLRKKRGEEEPQSKF